MDTEVRPLISLSLICLLILLTSGIGLLGVRKVKMDLPQLVVGGRSLGRVLLWLLMAGENYTSYTFLGAAGWAYSKGICTFYVFSSYTISCILSFFIFPPLWRSARTNGLMTNADYFEVAYQSRWLGVVAGVVGIVSLVPFVALQLTGIQILLQIASYGKVTSVVAAGLAFFVIVAFILAGGIRGVAFASVFKDGMMVCALVFAGIVLPIHFAGSPAKVITQVLREHPQWMTLSAGGGEFGLRWFVSTICLAACGAVMWPHAVGASFSARDEDAIRWNAVRLPFYQLLLLLVYFAGFTALLVRPGLTGSAVDQSFMLVVQEHYSPWVLGAIAGTGCLAALLPAGAQVLAAASLISRNVVNPLFGGAREQQRVSAMRWLAILVATLAFGLWAFADTTIIGLVLMGYSIIAQLFPGVVFSFLSKPPKALSVAIGMAVAFAILIASRTLRVNTWSGINIGLVALVANALSLLACNYGFNELQGRNSDSSRQQEKSAIL
jgi:SSS family solute:Na+ symporter